MGRIRTIKPEFPQSETIGKLSREARLLFIQLFTLADDEGRGRGAGPVLVGALYPYDDDAARLIGAWLDELVTHECVTIYQHDGSTFFQIINWTKHQKIDRPSTSRFPSPGGEMAARIAEKDIEAAIYDAVCRDGRFAGRTVIDVQRQVRVGSSYLDLVIKAGAETFVVEIKRDRMSGADLAKVKRYCELVDGIPVLIGSGLSPKLSVEECVSAGVAVVAHNAAGISILVPSKNVTECSITFASVTERSSTDLGPRTVDQVPGPRTEDHSRAVAGAPPAVLVGNLFLQFWEAYPKRDGANPKEPARKKFVALIKNGESADAIVASAKTYAGQLRAKGQEGTQYVAQAITWLTESRWLDYTARPDHAESLRETDRMMASKGFAWVDGRWQKEEELMPV